MAARTIDASSSLSTSWYSTEELHTGQEPVENAAGTITRHREQTHSGSLRSASW